MLCPGLHQGVVAIEEAALAFGEAVGPKECPTLVATAHNIAPTRGKARRFRGGRAQAWAELKLEHTRPLRNMETRGLEPLTSGLQSR